MAMNAEQLEIALQDALADRANLDTYIIGLQARIRSLGGVPTELAVRPPTCLDQCEEMLRKAGHPLHCEVMLPELRKNGRQSDYDFNNLLQDAQGRFEKVGFGWWALREWPEEVKAPFRESGKSSRIIAAQKASPIREV